MSEPSTPAVALDENQLMHERREKLKAIRARQAQGEGVAFPNDFQPDTRPPCLKPMRPKMQQSCSRWMPP